MKTLYDVLSKEDKIKTKKEFCTKNKELNARINRIFLFGILLIVFSLVVSSYSIITKEDNMVMFLIIYGFALVVGVFFIVKSLSIKKQALNRMLASKKGK